MRNSVPDLVSVIIPVFNRGGLLREAVASVVAQTHRPIEIVVVNDGSTDDTLDVAVALQRSFPEITAVLGQANSGPGAARETGRLAARGEFIQYLDSDDLLEPRKFELQVAGLRAHPECGVSYGFTRLRRADGSAADQPFKRTGEHIETMFPAFLESRWWDTSTPLFRSELLQEAGPWLPLRTEEDWEYDARVAALGVRLHFCAEWVSETRQIDPDRVSLRQGPAVLRDRADAHARILGHARRAGIARDTPEMQHFARELFLLARQCGAAGMVLESRRVFDLALDASTESRRTGLDFRAYRALAACVGWRTAGTIAGLADKLRPVR
ncbi:MAG: glycosyltransferase family A protein [Thermoanaerobaculia bacterium]